ncbi:MAG: hypothetical protein L6R48_01855 [Planctomycetes bacterium]|nr:hypothetical protein [Planctomycetota bacterium]
MIRSNPFRTERLRWLTPVWMSCAAGLLPAADLVVHNPFPEAMAGTFAVPAESLGVGDGEVRLVRGDNGQAVRCQRSEVDGRDLVIGGLELPGHGGVVLRAEADPAHHRAQSLLTSEDPRVLRVGTPLYALDLDAGQGYGLTRIEDRVRRLEQRLTGGLDAIDDGEQDAWNGHLPKPRSIHRQREAAVSATILYQGPCEAALRLSWPAGGSTTALVMRFNAVNRLVGQEVELAPGPRVIQARYHLNLANFSSKRGEGTVLPLDERNPHRAIAAPGHAFLWNPERRLGLGLVAPEGGGLASFTWEMRGAREGLGGDTNDLMLHSPGLRGMAAPRAVAGRFARVAGGTPQEAALLAPAAARPRAFSAYPGRSRPAAVLPPLTMAVVGRAQPLALTCDESLVGRSVRLQAGAQVLFAGTVPADRRLAATWTPAADGLQELALAEAAGERLGDWMVPVRKAVEIIALTPTRLVFKPGEAETARVVLRNRSGAPSEVVLRTALATALDRQATAADQTVALAPDEVRAVELGWSSGMLNAGATLRVEAVVGGQVADRAEEVFALADSHVKVGQYVATNPWCNNTPGTDDTLIKNMRNNYFSAFEYYCWTPCPFTGLTPPGDSWVPHTENMSFEITVRKDFVLGMVRKAHEAGLQVFPWMNGEVALPTGLTRPEHYRYSAGGQPILYSGQVWSGKRFAIAYSASPYSEQASADWGRRLADSIDLFGWDGCRFDWEFTPTVVGDPMRAGETTWYNFEGKSSQELFPQPDRQGTAYLKAFRKAVAERHPGFRFGTNSGMSDEMWERQPEYSAESSRDAWMWYEHLMGYTAKNSATWTLWADRLVSAYRRTRPLGAQVGVGWMRDYPPGTVSHKLMHFAVLFSGYKWIGAWDRHDPLGEGWKCWRYAMRFAQYFYGNDFLFVDPARLGGEIAIQGDAGAMWRPWVTERVAPGSREVLIGVLNTPPDAYVSERRPLPAPRTGLKARIALQPGERIASSHLLAPEPMPLAIALPAPGADGVIALPAIPWAAAVLVRIERPAGGK